MAVVAVHADMPAFIKPGQELMSPFQALVKRKACAAARYCRLSLKVSTAMYAIAQGSLVVSGFSADGLDGSKVIQNTPTVVVFLTARLLNVA